MTTETLAATENPESLARLDEALAAIRAAVLESGGLDDVQISVAPPRVLGGRRVLGTAQVWWVPTKQE